MPKFWYDVHEAGHATVAFHYKMDVDYVVTSETLGGVTHRTTVGVASKYKEKESESHLATAGSAAEVFICEKEQPNRFNTDLFAQETLDRCRNDRICFFSHFKHQEPKHHEAQIFANYAYSSFSKIITIPNNRLYFDRIRSCLNRFSFVGKLMLNEIASGNHVTEEAALCDRRKIPNDIIQRFGL